MKTLYTLFSFATFILLGTAFGQLQVDTFYYSGASEIFVITDCMGPITIDVRGGQGGDNFTASGGLGGRVEGEMTFNSGDTLYINVGTAGLNGQGNASGVFVGSGGTYSYSSGGVAGTGGGASDIRLNGTTLNDRIVVGGGGGGAGGNSGQPLYGGAGGGLIAGDGLNWNTWPDAGGKGGTQSAGGTQGNACCSCPTYTTDGSLGLGGNGAGDGAGGGGGGGGYYGGGGACFSGGGGGSSYADPGMTSVNHTQGYQTGEGMIILSYTLGNETTSNQTLATCDSMVSPSGLYVWNTTGIYMDTIPNSAGCDSIMTIDLTVNSVNAGATQTSVIELMADATGASYQWLDCDNGYSAISGATNQNYVASANGNYAVMVTENGCTDTSACFTITNVSTTTYELSDLVSVYPNPFNDEFQVQFNELKGNALIEVNDITGKVVYSKSISDHLTTIALVGESGVYFVTITHESEVVTYKLIKN